MTALSPPTTTSAKYDNDMPPIGEDDEFDKEKEEECKKVEEDSITNSFTDDPQSSADMFLPSPSSASFLHSATLPFFPSPSAQGAPDCRDRMWEWHDGDTKRIKSKDAEEDYTKNSHHGGSTIFSWCFAPPPLFSPSISSKSNILPFLLKSSGDLGKTHLQLKLS